MSEVNQNFYCFFPFSSEEEGDNFPNIEEKKEKKRQN